MLSSWQWISSCLYYLSKLVKCDSALKILCEFLYFQFINPFTFDILGTCVVYCPPNVKLDCYTGLFCTFSFRAAVRAVGPLNGLLHSEPCCFCNFSHLIRKPINTWGVRWTQLTNWQDRKQKRTYRSACNIDTRGYYKCNSQKCVVCTCAKTMPIFCNHNLASWPLKAIAKIFRLLNKILGHIFEWRRLLVGCWYQTGSQYLRNCSCPLGFSS